jgi:transcriptional regulator with XRE-family HTH domain
MPEPTLGRAGVEPPKGALVPSQILARNVGALRRLRGYRQEFIAKRIMYLGHSWSRQTVGEIEQGRRNVTVDELFSLALALHITIDRLLDARVDRLIDPNAKAARPGKVALVRPTSVAASRANSGESPEMLIDAGDLHGLLCGHEVDVVVNWDDDEPWRLIMVEFHDKGEKRR